MINSHIILCVLDLCKDKLWPIEIWLSRAYVININGNVNASFVSIILSHFCNDVLRSEFFMGKKMGWFGCYLVLTIIIFCLISPPILRATVHSIYALSLQRYSLCITLSNSLNFVWGLKAKEQNAFFLLSSISSCTKISALKNVQMEEAIFYCGDAVCHKVCNVLNMADAKKLPPITRKKRRGKESGRQGY